jgi:anti-sigma factor RsiW
MRVEPLEIDELLGAYALDAVSSEERAIVESYLRGNPRARTEVFEHREVATMLAYSGASAPDGLWDRIAGSLEEPAPAPGPELAKVLPLSSARRRQRGRTTMFIAAGLAAAAALGVVASRALDTGSTQPSLAAAASAAQDDRDSRLASLVADGGSEVAIDAVVDQDGHGYLLAGDLPVLPADKTYQLWGVLDGEVISLGVLGNRPEVESFTATPELTTLVLTIEEAGGVVSSEQPAAFAGELA